MQGEWALAAPALADMAACCLGKKRKKNMREGVVRARVKEDKQALAATCASYSLAASTAAEVHFVVFAWADWVGKA